VIQSKNRPEISGGFLKVGLSYAASGADNQDSKDCETWKYPDQFLYVF
jgi:hypothetical protein